MFLHGWHFYGFSHRDLREEALCVKTAFHLVRAELIHGISAAKQLYRGLITNALNGQRAEAVLRRYDPRASQCYCQHTQAPLT